MLASIVTQSKAITIFLNGKNYSVQTDHPRYADIVCVLKDHSAATKARLDGFEPEDEIEDLEEALSRMLVESSKPLSGHAEIVDGKFMYEGEEVHSSLARRIVEIDGLGLPPGPMIEFFKNVQANPSEASREELYIFLEHLHIPITEDGCFLAYKAIRSNYTDKHTGTIDNSPGKIVEIPRDQVDDDRHVHCSHGLHAGAIGYVRSFGNYNDRFVIVKINPRDVVSVPADHNGQKLRVCRYEVLMEVERETILEAPVYSATGGQYSVPSFSADDWDWGDEDDDYEEEEEYLNSLWRETGRDEDEQEAPSPSFDEAAFLNEKIEDYQQNYDRDNVCRLAFERGLTKTIEAGRTLGKAAVCRLLAEQDLRVHKVNLQLDLGRGWSEEEEKQYRDLDWEKSDAWDSSGC